MNLFLRFLWLLVRRTVTRAHVDVFDACSTPFWVNPLDLDLNLHVNNGRYLSMMDLGRFDLLLRAGVFWTLVRRGYYPVVVSESIRFKASLMPFQRFSIRTTLESWDERDFYMTQTFLRGDVVVAAGYIKGRFKRRGRPGSVPTAEIFAAIGKVYPGERLSVTARAQMQIERALMETQS